MSEASRPHITPDEIRRLVQTARLWLDEVYGDTSQSALDDIEEAFTSLFEQYEDVKRERDGLAGRNQFLSTEVLRLDILVRSTQEQLEAARTDLAEAWTLIWLEDSQYVEGGSRKLDAWASRMQAKYGFDDDSFPATEAVIQSDPDTSGASGLPGTASVPAIDPRGGKVIPDALKPGDLGEPSPATERDDG